MLKMVNLLYSTLVISVFCSVVFAHGFLGAIRANGVDHKGWKVFVDRFIDPQPIRATRPFRDNGPIDDFTTKAITCNSYPNVGAGDKPPAKGNDGTYVESIPVEPGEKLTMIWNSWSIYHPGPVITCLANCNGNYKTFKGDTGNVWVKIDRVAYDKSKDPPWGSTLLTRQNATWRITVPPTLAPGEYVIRHELLALHVANTRMGTQFYPSCAHLLVSENGTQQLPTGVASSGAYDPDDTKGIKLHTYDIETGKFDYVAPRGEV